MTGEEVRAWAQRCADVTRGRMPESVLWKMIAHRYPGGQTPEWLAQQERRDPADTYVPGRK